jgi:hypothetical protein
MKFPNFFQAFWGANFGLPGSEPAEIIDSESNPDQDPKQ